MTSVSARIADGARGRWPIVLLLILGAAERIAWNVLRPTSGAAGEAMRVARAVGDGRGFADAYRVGQGATAHLLPINPGFAGLVYRMFGQGTASEIVLAGVSIGFSLGAYLMLYRAFAHLGTPRWARLAGLAFGCLAPAYIGQEAVDFRVWEGALAAFLTAWCLERVLAAATDPRPVAARQITAMAVLTGLLFFVNPPLGLAAYAAAFVLALRRLAWPGIASAIAQSALVLALLVGPWAWRNERAMGTPILLRSNAGLELALGQYDGATAPGNRKTQFLARLRSIHPIYTKPYARMRAAGGEVAYAQALGIEAKAWMAAHPAEVATLIARHLRQSLVPERWQFDVFGTNLSPTLRAAITDFVGIAGLIGLAAALIRRRRDWLYPALLIGLWAIVTSPFQPVTRYTYLIYPFMLFCAADLLGTWRAGAARPR